MIGKVILLAFLCGVAQADNRANQFVDNAIHTHLVQALLDNNLKPAHLPGFSVNFGVQDIYGKQGEAIFSDGVVSNLERLSREGDCSGPSMVRGEISINCTLRLTLVITEFKVLIKNSSNVYQPRNMGHVGEITMRVEISERPQTHTGLRFKVENIGQITPTFSGLPSSLSKYLQVLQNAYRNHVSTHLFNLLQRNYGSALSSAFSAIRMPNP